MIDAKQQEVRDAMQALYPGGFGQMTPEERQQRMAKTQELQDKAVADILMGCASTSSNCSSRGRSPSRARAWPTS